MAKPSSADFFILHDVAHFPLVHLNSERMKPGFAEQWCKEQERLLDARVPFVLLLQEGDDDHESIQDRNEVVLWFKKNRQSFRGVCRGIVGIEPDAIKRALLYARALVLGPVFGVTTTVAADGREAGTIARNLLANGSNEFQHREMD
ncbi:MAG: hypothetical protein ACOYJQ_16290 [Pseudochelatococcus sp.]|uniref:hypothetical protein n=1 Tax=Pseudochelatococcus sp. TaxID=2020869 RepID=UPI003D8EBC6F